MLKRPITYKDFEGNTVTDVHYFNISKSELVILETEYDQGFSTFITNIIEAKDNNKLVQMFQKLILKAYGKKSEDGKRFIKSDQLREEFSQTAAYDALFMELASDDNAAIIFLKGILPPDMTVDVTKLETKPPDLKTV